MTIMPRVPMQRLTVLLALFLSLHGTARAQEHAAPDGTPVTFTQISGIDEDRLSPGLRQEIDALVGKPLRIQDVNALAARIEAERPDFVVAARTVLTRDGEARVIFMAARIQGDRRLEENINARYTIESVDVEGVAEDRLSQALRDDIHRLVGTRVDHWTMERLAGRIRDELPGYDVSRHMSRGSERGRLRLVFAVRKSENTRWLHFQPSTSKLVYHSQQGWSGLFDLDIGTRDWRVSPLFALGNDDDRIEEYSGYGLRVETRNAGVERLGLGLELTTFDATWKAETLAALGSNPSLPDAYRRRSTIAPSLTFAFTPRVRATAGVSITELERLDRSRPSQSANAFAASLGYDQRWTSGEVRHAVEALVALKAGSDTLQSDVVYERYVTSAAYQVRWGHSELLASGTAGRATARAPLFERFTLGDSSTLRGWNKYDIAPAGGDRMAHGSVEYRNRGFAFFLDGGSVWNAGADAHARVSTGVGYHHEHVFVTLGFPLNTDDVRTVFMMGVRF
jgi:hypothetical protein